MRLFSLFICSSALFVLGAGQAFAASVSSLPGLESITFYERTSGTEPVPYTFDVGSSELTTLLIDPLSAENNDFGGASTEYYDVYYSNADGSFNLLGEYLTIAGVYGNSLPSGGGLNLAEISLNFLDTSIEYGNYVASFEAYGDNAIPEFVGRAIDGDLLTHTVMGNTSATDSRLRVTLGFLSSSGPAPSPVPLPAGLPLFLGAFGLLGLTRLSRRR